MLELENSFFFFFFPQRKCGGGGSVGARYIISRVKTTPDLSGRRANRQKPERVAPSSKGLPESPLQEVHLSNHIRPLADLKETHFNAVRVIPPRISFDAGGVGSEPVT